MTDKRFSDQQIADSYVYLLGRFLVLRQEITDMQEDGVGYNVVKYNPVGSADFVNPNLDVAYLEAWIAVDSNTPAILSIPEIHDRYYTAQILDEWGEVIANINERNFPDSPFGDFALCAPGSDPELPANAVPIALHSNKAKLLARVELKDDWDGAVELQKQFTVKSTGNPVIDPPIEIRMFDNETLAGVEIFDAVDPVLATAADSSPVAAEQATLARQISAYIAVSDTNRSEVDQVIKANAVPQFLKYAVTEAGSFKNNWLATLTAGNYGSDFWTRTAANLVGIWANNSGEVVYFVATRDGDGAPLDGSHTYRVHFPANQRPDAVVNGYWSIILVSLPDYRVVPNPDNRFNLNSYSPLVANDDGSLDLFFSPDRGAAVHAENWLPTSKGAAFSLTLRTYVPKDIVKQGDWFPPPIQLIA